MDTTWTITFLRGIRAVVLDHEVFELHQKVYSFLKVTFRVI